MRHNDGFDNGDSTLDSDPIQESVVEQMRKLLSAFERGIEGSGPLVECREVANLRRQLHASCLTIRDGLNGLSHRTLRLERAEKKYMQEAGRLNRAMAGYEEELPASKPRLWLRA